MPGLLREKQAMGGKSDLVAIRDRLSGGDLSSIGRANAVARRARREPKTVRVLVALMLGQDRLIAARAADALEKASMAAPGILDPYRVTLATAIRRDRPPEVEWHLCQMLPRLDLDGAEARRAIEWLAGRFRDAESRIVKAEALTAACAIAARYPRHAGTADALMAEALQSDIPAVRARARKLKARPITPDAPRQERGLEPRQRSGKQRGTKPRLCNPR
ncbi:MAG TPA: hypothetical protein VMT54_15305 [Candidatus Cybelea sp.]|nr:hypothetical protein [Candidatus Cybelea sp.]